MTNDQQGHPSSKANNHFTCGACSSGCGWDCAAAPEGRRNFLVSRACCTVYCNLPGCCFHLRIGAKKTHPGSMGGGEMPLRKIAASLAENSGFSCEGGSGFSHSCFLPGFSDQPGGFRSFSDPYFLFISLISLCFPWLANPGKTEKNPGKRGKT